MNTILALLGASVAAFASSSAFSGKFNMVHIQNATLAGGVAIGSAANLNFTPAGAVGVGILAGVLSTAGFRLVLSYTVFCGCTLLHLTNRQGTCIRTEGPYNIQNQFNSSPDDFKRVVYLCMHNQKEYFHSKPHSPTALSVGS